MVAAAPLHEERTCTAGGAAEDAGATFEEGPATARAAAAAEHAGDNYHAHLLEVEIERNAILREILAVFTDFTANFVQANNLIHNF